MIDVEVENPEDKEMEIEKRTDEESEEPAYIEKKTVPLPVKSSIYLPIFEVNTAPKIRKWVEPEYPATARQAGIETSVIVELDIDESGMVADARIVRSGGEDFDRATLEAVRNSVFYPGLKRGKPVPVRVRLPVRFELE